MWDLHKVPGPKCCSTPNSNANSILPMGDVHHRHLYLGRNHLPDMQWLLFKDDPCLISSIWPQQHCQCCLTAQRDVLRAWNSWSTSLWQWPSVCKCTVNWVLHLLGYHTPDLKPSLPTIKWICWGMCKSMKHVLQCIKYSSTNPKLALLALWATPINAKLPSPAELLYWCQIRTTIPARIPNTKPAALQIYEWIDAHSDASKSQADKWWNPLHPCILASPLQDTTPSARSGSLPLWYVSCWKTATKCAPVMAWSTAVWDDTSMNVVSSPLTLPQMSHQPHCRLLPDLAFLQHCLHLPSLHNYCSPHLLHLQWLWLQNHRHQLPPKLPLCLCLCLKHPA